MISKKRPLSRSPIPNKITPPGLHRTAQRERLYNVLDQCEPAQGIWVSGAAGSGKSTLVRSYVAARRIPCIWYRVDGGDGDPASFFYYLGMAVQQAADQTAPRLPLLTPEYLPGLRTFTIRYFEKLGQRVARPFWIIFDNYQEVPYDSPLQDILGQAVRHLATGMKFCIISRTEPGPAMARLVANRLMAPIDGAQLMFTVDEYAQLLQALEQPPQILQQVDELHQWTGGWIAGLILWLQHARNTPENHPLAERPPVLIFDYFANEVLKQLKPSVRQFLLQVSFLMEMTAETAARLTETPAAGEILESFARRNFFLEKSSDAALRYRFHSLFRQFLQDCAVNTLPAGMLHDLRCRCAAIMAEDGLWDEAIRLYEQARNWKALAGLILSQAPGLAAQGRFKTLTGWINKLPPAACQQNPFLFLWAGIGQMPFSPRKGQTLCSRAFENFKSANDLCGQVMSWCSVVDSFFLIRSDVKELDRWIKEGMRLSPALAERIDPDLFGRFCAGMIGACLWRRPDHPDMPRWQKRGEDCLSACSDPHTLAALLNVLCFSYNWFGQTNRAIALKVRLSIIMQRFGMAPVLQALWAANEGMCLLGEGRPRQSLQKCERALQFAQKTGIHIYDSLVLSGRVYSALLLGEIQAADEYLHQMAAHLLPDARWDWTNYYVLSTMMALLLEDIPKAKTLANHNLELTVSCGTPYNIAYMTIIRAQVRLHAGDLSAAESDLERVAAMNILPNVVLLKFLFELTAADIDRVMGRREKALGHLRRAFSAAAENGCYFVFGVNRNRLPELCALALEAGIETAFAAELIERYQLPPPASGFAGDAWPYEIKVYTLGRREIHLKGKLMALSATKVPRKTLDLLTTLICVGRKGMLRETIADHLWPDADGDRAQQNMNTTLYRLRRWLAKEGAIAYENGRLFLSWQYCWVDAWCFDALYEQAMTAGSPGEKTALLRKAVHLYAGPMEADGVVELSVSYAGHLKNKFSRAVLELGWFLSENGQTDEALDLYQYALDVDESVEKFYQALLRLLIKLGRNTEAVDIYRKCCRVLKRQFACAPSPATRMLCREVTTADDVI